jgi:hypothetical protein
MDDLHSSGLEELEWRGRESDIYGARIGEMKVPVVGPPDCRASADFYS